MSRTPLDQLEGQWRHEARQQPPGLSARQAAARVRNRIADSTPGRGWHLRWGAAAAVAAALVLLVWSPFGPVPAPTDAGATATLSTPPLADDVVLLWLDADTPLYLTLKPPTAERGDST